MRGIQKELLMSLKRVIKTTLLFFALTIQVVSQPSYSSLKLAKEITEGKFAIIDEKHLQYNTLNELLQKAKKAGIERLIISSILIDEIPISIGDIKTLRILEISFTSIDSLPSSIGLLSNLEELTLSLNDSLQSLPSTIGSLNSLKAIYAHNNKNLSLIPPSIGTLPNLHILELRDNSISSFDVVFDSLNNKLNLDLKGNQISKLPTQLLSTQSMIYLSLDKNKIDSLPPEILDIISINGAEGSGKYQLYLNVKYNPLVHPPYKTIEKGRRALKRFYRNK